MSDDFNMEEEYWLCCILADHMIMLLARRQHILAKRIVLILLVLSQIRLLRPPVTWMTSVWHLLLSFVF